MAKIDTRCLECNHEFPTEVLVIVEDEWDYPRWGCPKCHSSLIERIFSGAFDYDTTEEISINNRILSLLSYDPETGNFIRKISLPNSCHKKGDLVGSIDKNGYLVTSIDNKKYFLSNLAFLFMLGYLPENGVDHKNRIRSDNRWSNLREVSKQCQSRNQKIPITNKSGVKGISKTKHGKWLVNIKINGKTYNLGAYWDLLEAVYHRLAAEQCLGWEGCDSSSSAYQFVNNKPPFKYDEVKYVTYMEGSHD
jgi:hypothetical protein